MSKMSLQPIPFKSDRCLGAKLDAARSGGAGYMTTKSALLRATATLGAWNEAVSVK